MNRPAPPPIGLQRCRPTGAGPRSVRGQSRGLWKEHGRRQLYRSSCVPSSVKTDRMSPQSSLIPSGQISLPSDSFNSTRAKDEPHAATVDCSRLLKSDSSSLIFDETGFGPQFCPMEMCVTASTCDAAFSRQMSSGSSRPRAFPPTPYEAFRLRPPRC